MQNLPGRRNADFTPLLLFDIVMPLTQSIEQVPLNNRK